MIFKRGATGECCAQIIAGEKKVLHLSSERFNLCAWKYIPIEMKAFNHAIKTFN
jgi:hypothetical protein